MATYQKFNQFVEDLAKGKHNLASDTLKVLLTNVAPVATNAVKADLTDLSTANGYTAGGNTLVQTSCVQTSGTLKLVLPDSTFTASGGSVGPFRYAALYNDTPSSPAKPLIGFFDYGSSVTLNDGEQFVVDLDQAAGVFTLV